MPSACRFSGRLLHFLEIALVDLEKGNISADADMVFAANFQGVLEMLDEVLAHRLFWRRRDVGEHVNAEDAAFVGERFHLAVFLVARMHVDRAATGVSDERRLGGSGDAIGCRFRVRMAEIERDTDLVHLRDGLAAELGHAIGFAIKTTDSKRSAPVIIELHDADAELAEQFDPLDFVFEHGSGLERVDDAELLFFLRPLEDRPPPAP